MPISSFLLQTATGTGAGGAAAGGFGMLIPLILIIAIMYFFMIRPQNKKQKELQKMLNALQKGDKVVTIGGIHGTISHVEKESDTVWIKVDDNTKIKFNRSAISSVVNDKPADADAKAGNEKKGFGLFGRKKDVAAEIKDTSDTKTVTPAEPEKTPAAEPQEEQKAVDSSDGEGKKDE